MENPAIGEIKTYMPNSTEGRLYTYDKNFIVDEKLEYKGASKSNPQTLEIGSQGGSALIRFSNTGIGQYIHLMMIKKLCMMVHYLQNLT